MLDMLPLDIIYTISQNLDMKSKISLLSINKRLFSMRNNIVYPEKLELKNQKLTMKYIHRYTKKVSCCSLENIEYSVYFLPIFFKQMIFTRCTPHNFILDIPVQNNVEYLCMNELSYFEPLSIDLAKFPNLHSLVITCQRVKEIKNTHLSTIKTVLSTDFLFCKRAKLYNINNELVIVSYFI